MSFHEAELLFLPNRSRGGGLCARGDEPKNDEGKEKQRYDKEGETVGAILCRCRRHPLGCREEWQDKSRNLHQKPLISAPSHKPLASVPFHGDRHFHFALGGSESCP